MSSLENNPPTSDELSYSSLVVWASKCPPSRTPVLDAYGNTLRVKECCFCGQDTKLGGGSSDASLIQHMLSKKCRRAQQKLGNPPTPQAPTADDTLPLSSYLETAAFSDLIPDLLTQHHATPVSHLPPLSDPGAPTVADLENVAEEREPCPGTLVNWPKSMFSHYPWHLHDKGILPYRLSFVDPAGMFFRAQSLDCLGKSTGGGEACETCKEIVSSPQFQEVVNRVEDPMISGIDSQYLTYAQLDDTLRTKMTQIEALKQQISSQRRRSASSGSISETESSMMIGTLETPAIEQATLMKPTGKRKADTLDPDSTDPSPLATCRI